MPHGHTLLDGEERHPTVGQGGLSTQEGRPLAFAQHTKYNAGMPTPTYRLEKAGLLIRSACKAMEQARTCTEAAGYESLKPFFERIFWDATKLYCDALRELDGKQFGSERWSPDLPKFLAERPQDCEETLRILASEDYRDNYYDKPFSKQTDLGV